MTQLASATMTALAINGFNQHISVDKFGQQNPWLMANTLDDAGFTVSAREESYFNIDPDELTAKDLMQTWDVIAAYSWALKSILSYGIGLLKCRLFLGILIVDDPCGFCPDPVLPDTVERAYVFQVTPPHAFPISKPLAFNKKLGDRAAVWVDFVDLGSPNVPQDQKDAFWNFLTSHTRVNINCNNIASGDAVSVHTHLENDDRVLALAARLATNLS